MKLDQSHKKPILVFADVCRDICLEAMSLLQEMLLLENIDACIFSGDHWQDLYALEAFQRADVVLTSLQDFPREQNLREVVLTPFVQVGKLCFRIDDRDNLSQDFWNIHKELQGMYGPPPLVGCVLIGGKSSRMGQAKHLLKSKNGRTWIEEAVARLIPHVTEVVLVGAGEIPASLVGLQRIGDADGLAGPLAGIVGACRAFPTSSWLLVACDMPLVSDVAIEWLLAQRALGRWAVVPVHGSFVREEPVASKGLEPLFACYESQSGFLFERLVTEKVLRIGAVAEEKKVHLASIPPQLEEAWTNINTPEDADSL